LQIFKRDQPTMIVSFRCKFNEMHVVRA
jgi:hypothetical protein